MQLYLFKSAATLMAMVMAMTAIVCRCGMAACVSQAHAQVVAQPQRTEHCGGGCANRDQPSDRHQAPEKCDDCGNGKTVLDRPSTESGPVVEVQLFAPTVEYARVDPVDAPHARPDHGVMTTAPPIDPLRQSCLLLI